MKVLIISPHMDDEVLGTGGLIAKHKAGGDEVNVIFVAHRVYDHKFDETKNNEQVRHALQAKEVLGYDDAIFMNLPDERLDCSIQDIVIPLEQHIDELNPEFVYIPFRGDNNQDHRAVFDAARIVLRPMAAPTVNGVYMYEVPSSTEQSPPLSENAFIPNYYVDISDHIRMKIEAFRCYESELRAYPHPRSLEGLKILAQKRGIEIGFQFSEAFMILRHKWGHN